MSSINMYILSFDIGIKNLAYCYTLDDEILSWDVFDIKGNNVNETCEKCVRVLHDTFNNKQINSVLIENQPVQKNPTMKTIQIVVYTYFVYSKMMRQDIETVSFVSANKKNKLADKFDIEVTGSSKYLRSKKKAVLVTREILKNDNHWLTFFNAHKKKDDLADSYLQLLSWTNYAPVLPNPPSPRSDTTNSATSLTSQHSILESIN